MAYDQGLAERLAEYFHGRPDVEVKRMFGGLCYLIAGNMCCGIVGERLMLRVGPAQYEACLRQPHVSKMDFTGKPLKGMVYVAPAGFERDEDLARWLGLAEAFVGALPPKRK